MPRNVARAIEIIDLTIDAILLLRWLMRLIATLKHHRHPTALASDMGSEVTYDLLSGRFTLQNQRIDALDAKGTSAFYSGTTALVIVAALIQVNRKSLTVLTLLFLALGAACYVISGALITLSFRVKRFESRPHLEDLTDVSEHHDLAVTRRWLARELRTSLEYNEPMIHKKSTLIYISLILLFFQALCLSIAAVSALY